MKIAIAGAGNAGRAIARELIANRQESQVIEDG
jgi:Trk K+ transport system NAD-binding subunit